MKLQKLLLVSLLFFGWTAAKAQSPEITANMSVSVATNGAGIPVPSVMAQSISWSVVGNPSACTVELDSSADNMSWSTGGAIGLQSCLNPGSSGLVNVLANYVRIHVASISGGTVNVNYRGQLITAGVGSSGNGAPTGACLAGSLYTDRNTGNLYSCDNGTWILAGGGAAPSVTCSTVDAFIYWLSSTTQACDSGITTNTSGQLSVTGGLVAVSDGVHAGIASLIGNTAAPAIPSNSFGFIGPNSASFTSWFIQPSATAPTAGCIPLLAVPSTNVSAMTCTASLNYVAPTLTLSGVGLGNAVLALSGTTSGTATFTAPAVAGTRTNPVLVSNSVQLATGNVLNWNGDTGFSRASGGSIDVGNGTAADTSGTMSMNTINASNIGLSNAVFGVTGHEIQNTAAPTFSSGFGSGAAVGANPNGTASFTVNVGTGGVASTGVIAMPTATNGWHCFVAPNAAPQAAAVTYSAPTSATSITLTNYTLTTGIALAWTASTVLQLSCWGF